MEQTKFNNRLEIARHRTTLQQRLNVEERHIQNDIKAIEKRYEGIRHAVRSTVSTVSNIYSTLSRIGILSTLIIRLFSRRK